ncbi:uncharacterized protein LOC114249774 [Bombyx mandarina]|uniref:Uncharacterized protein LOC114249774 n=1 Tax=Bombyx mandarina TaxID=7092 RepID=A0A6J2KBG6_BOMMA|nr:uncharacterized protein LOC114249774 [Bombyx mandarina]
MSSYIFRFSRIQSTMKAFIFALALACVSAVPHRDVDFEPSSQRILDIVISNLFNEIGELLRAADPLRRDGYAGSWSPPGASDIINFSGRVTDVKADDFSSLHLRSVSYVGTRLNLVLAVPRVSASVGAAEGEIRIFSRVLRSFASGGLALENVVAEATASVSLAGDIIVSDIGAAITIGDVKSNLQINLFGREVGPAVNDFLEKIPVYLTDYAAEVSRVLEYVAQLIINRLL